MAINFQLLRSSTASKRPTAANLDAGELGLNFNDSTSGLFYENASGAIMKVGPAEVSSAAPNASPAAGGSTGNSLGELWYDTGNTALKIWDGDSWEIANSGSTAGIVTSANATAITIGSNEQCTFSQSVTLQGSDVTASAALDFNVIDNTAQALRILGGGTELIRVTTTDGSEMLDVSTTTKLDGAVDVNGAVDVAGQITFSVAQALLIPDNSGTALRVLEGSNEYMRFTTTDGGEKIQTTKELEVNGALNIDGDVDCSGQITFSAAQTISIPDNTGFGLRVSSDGSEYVRFTTTDGAELVDFSKTVKFDGAVDINSTVDISGGDVTFSANADIHIPDNSAQAFDIAEGTNNYVRFVTSDGSEHIEIEKDLELAGIITYSAATKVNVVDNSASAYIIQQGDSEPIMTVSSANALPTVTFDYRVVFDEDILFTGAHDILMTDNTASALTIGEATNAYMTFDTTDGSELVTTEKPLAQVLASSVTPANNTEMMFELTNDTTLTIKVKGSDGTVRSGTVTLS